MPILVRTIELVPGMSLARTVRLGDDIVLPVKRILINSDVSLLTERRPDLYVSVASPELDSVCTFENDALEIAASSRVCDVAAGALHLAHAAINGRSQLRIEDFRVAEHSIIHIESFLRQHRILHVRLGDRPPRANVASTADAAKAVHLAMILGGAVRAHLVAAQQRASGNAPIARSSIPSLVHLGLAALLRDISLWSARRTLDHPGPLTSAERELIVDHPARSVGLLPDTIDSSIRTAIMHHHENHCGTGYPRGISGDEIPLFARIVRMADAFSAATSEAAFRTPKPVWLVSWEMTCGPYAECYDPGVRKIFQNIVQPYPIGSKLRLACGRYAVVVRHGRIHGLLPEVVIAFDENDRPLPAALIKGPFRLERCPELRIVEYRGDDMTQVYGSEPIYLDAHTPWPAHFSQFAESTYP